MDAYDSDTTAALAAQPETAAQIDVFLVSDPVPQPRGERTAWQYATSYETELSIANHLQALTTMYEKYGRRVVEEIGAASDGGVIVNVLTAQGRYLYTLTISRTPGY